MSEEIYISVDIETNGPIPGPHSMWSLGAAAFTSKGEMLSTFSANLQDLPDSGDHPDTKDFWRRNLEAWREARREPRDPKDVMVGFDCWVRLSPGKPVFVAYPAGFDFTFVYWYLMKFVGSSPFGFSALDIKTYAAAMLKCDYRHAVKRNMPKDWFMPDGKHTHKALEDAIEQGHLFCNMLRDNRGKSRPTGWSLPG